MTDHNISDHYTTRRDITLHKLGLIWLSSTWLDPTQLNTSHRNSTWHNRRYQHTTHDTTPPYPPPPTHTHTRHSRPRGLLHLLLLSSTVRTRSCPCRLRSWSHRSRVTPALGRPRRKSTGRPSRGTSLASPCCRAAFVLCLWSPRGHTTHRWTTQMKHPCRWEVSFCRNEKRRNDSVNSMFFCTSTREGMNSDQTSDCHEKACLKGTTCSIFCLWCDQLCPCVRALPASRVQVQGYEKTLLKYESLELKLKGLEHGGVVVNDDRIKALDELLAVERQRVQLHLDEVNSKTARIEELERELARSQMGERSKVAQLGSLHADLSVKSGDLKAKTQHIENLEKSQHHWESFERHAASESLEAPSLRTSGSASFSSASMTVTTAGTTGTHNATDAIFSMIDKNGDGVITREEMDTAFGLSPQGTSPRQTSPRWSSQLICGQCLLWLS